MNHVEPNHPLTTAIARAITPSATLVITGAVVVLVAVSQLVITSSFFSRGTLSTLTPLIGILVLVAIGQALVISTGGIDLSLPATMTLMGAIVLKQSEGQDGGLLGALVLCAAACVVIGLVNGVLVEGLGLNSLVVTLAVGQLVLGCTQLYRGAVPPVQQVPGNLASWATADIAGISCILLVSFALAVLMTFLLHRVVVGRRLVAGSTAERAAVLAGIKARRYRIAAYVLAALVYGVGGVLAAGQTGIPDLSLGEPYLLTSVVAVVLGGAVLSGGRVSPIATLMGAVFITVLDFDLRVQGMSAGARLIVQGAVLVLGLSLIHVIRHRGGDRPSAAAARRLTLAAPEVPAPKRGGELMSFTSRSAKRGGWLDLSRGLCAAAVLVVAFAGCGDSESGSAGGSNAKAAGAQDEVKVSDVELQKTVDQALSSDDVEAASLPPLMRAALSRASRQLTPAQLDKAYTCWKATSCTLGDGPLTLAHVDPFGSNTWRQFTKMNVILQALTHPEVGKFIYTDANYDLSTYQANLRTVTAQGADAIVTINEFGPAANAALAVAQRQGASVATYVGDMDDAPANAYTTRVQYDLCATGKAMAQTIEKATSSKGPIAYFEGLAGNPQDAKVKSCVKDAGVQTAFTEATEYTAAGTQKAASALIASGKPAKAILYSYANTVPSIVNAYRKANKDLPAIVTLTQSNATICQRAERPYPLFVTNSANWASRIAVDASVKAANGEKVDKAVVFPLPFFEPTEADCDKRKPAEYPGPALVPEALTAKMLAAK